MAYLGLCLIALFVFLIVRPKHRTANKHQQQNPKETYEQPTNLKMRYDTYEERQEKWAKETWSKWTSTRYEHPWYYPDYLFSKNELAAYKLLFNVSKEFWLRVFPKVRLLDLLRPKGDYFKRFVSSLHVDFVLWSPRANRVICVLELLDESHNGWRSEYRDTFVREALKEAGYIYYELDEFKEDELRQLIQNAILGKPIESSKEPEQDQSQYCT